LTTDKVRFERASSGKNLWRDNRRTTDRMIARNTTRMREICLSGSMSGDRKQNQAKPD